MAEFSAIRAGIATNLRTLPGVSSEQVSAYRLENPTPPTLQVLGIDSMTPTAFGRGGFTSTWIVQGFVAKTLSRAAQERLDKWLHPDGTESVWAALETDDTLGGVIEQLTVISNDGLTEFQLPNGVELFGSTWTLEILL